MRGISSFCCRTLLQYSLNTSNIRFPSFGQTQAPEKTQPKTQYYVRDHHRLLILEPDETNLQNGILDMVDPSLAASIESYFRAKKITVLNAMQSYSLPVSLQLRAGLLVIAPTATGKTLLYAIIAILHVARSPRHFERLSAKPEEKVAKEPKGPACRACGLDMSIVRMCPEVGKMHPKLDTYDERMAEKASLLQANNEPLVVIVAPSSIIVRQVYDAIGQMTGKAINTAWYSPLATPEEQTRNINKASDIVVATPGKLYKLWKSGAVRLHNTTMYLFDEADKLLEATAIDTIRPLLDRAEATRAYTGFFCSTLPLPARKLIESHFKHAERRFYEICTRGMIRGKLEYAPATDAPCEHHVLMTTQTDKTNRVLDILGRDSLGPQSRVIIFCNSVRTVNFLAIELFSMLRKKSMRIFSLHQRQTPERQNKALQQFQKAGGESILVTSSLAARGVDFVGVDHIIHFDLPTTIGDYIHRCGRASRDHRKGFFYSLFIPEDAPLARSLVRYFKEVENPIQVPLKMQEYANEDTSERWKRLFEVTAPGSRYHKDRTRFESHRKPQIGNENAKYPDPKIKGLRKTVTPRAFELEHGIAKAKLAGSFRTPRRRR